MSFFNHVDDPALTGGLRVNDIVEIQDPKVPWTGIIKMIIDVGDGEIWANVTSQDGKGGSSVRLSGNNGYVKKVK